MKENTMNAVKTLIDQTFSYSIEDKDLKDLYLDDLKAFQFVDVQISLGNIENAVNTINDMDTEPREQIVCALAKDKGNDWVADNLGWEVC
jgi:hypothetical protein